jgi:hypothetical protein
MGALCLQDEIEGAALLTGFSSYKPGPEGTLNQRRCLFLHRSLRTLGKCPNAQLQRDIACLALAERAVAFCGMLPSRFSVSVNSSALSHVAQTANVSEGISATEECDRWGLS